MGSKYQTAATCWGEQNCPIHFHPSLWSKMRKWTLTDADSSEYTPLPLHMLESGQSLSSTSGLRHWLSSSLEIGRPESRSKQARKRLWIETILLPLISPPWEVLCCRGTHGEQGVHSDHSLRMTERRKSRVNRMMGLFNQELFKLLSLLCFLTFTLSHVTMQSSIMAKAGGQNSQKKLIIITIHQTECTDPRQTDKHKANKSG